MTMFNVRLWLRCSMLILLWQVIDGSTTVNKLLTNRFPVVSANWSSCPVLSDGTISVNNVYAECMILDVPIDWNEITVLSMPVDTLKIFVKRYFLLGSRNTSHQLWRIPGGGGIPISTLELEATGVVSALNGSVSIYATDKRSVGRSSLLECPTSIVTNFSACIPFIQQNQYRLKHNTFTNTARDLQYVLRVVAGERQAWSSGFKPRVVLMGSSQGTYLLQRYLHLMEQDDQVDAVILDSVLPTDITRLVYGDRYLNYIFLDLFTRCAQDYDGCAKYFEEGNPMRSLYTYSINADIGRDFSCLTQLNTTAEELGKKMSFIFYPGTMELLPALIYRINRCNANDRQVIARFLQQTLPPSEDGQPGFSILVELNNNFAELWSSFNDPNQKNDTFSCDELKGMSYNTFAATHVMPDIYCPIQRTGLLGYPTDQYYRHYPQNKSSIPVLLLHGDLDQALPVPVSRHFYHEYSKVNPKLIYVELPRTGHTATSASPIANRSDTCGWNVAASFILSPTFQPDTSCLQEISSIDFAGTTMRTKETALHFFGTDDIWGTEC